MKGEKYYWHSFFGGDFDSDSVAGTGLDFLLEGLTKVGLKSLPPNLMKEVEIYNWMIHTNRNTDKHEDMSDVFWVSWIWDDGGKIQLSSACYSSGNWLYN